MRRGSALLMALWTIMVLSVIVISFSFEARLQGGINVYVQNKNRVKRLVESGRILGEAVLLGYNDAKQWTEDEDEKELLEDDRWYREKRDLKYASKCIVGPILLDEDDPDSGTVEVEISISEHASEGGINVNKLFSEDPNYITRWQIILDRLGVSREEDFRTEEGKTINLQHRVIACWNDYRDEDDVTTSIDGKECGAENKEYEVMIEWPWSIPISTGVFISSSGVHYMPEKDFVEPSGGPDLERIVKNGVLRLYRPDYHCWVYQVGWDLYWITEDGFQFEEDGSTYIQYQLWTTQPENLPEKRRAHNHRWDNIGGRFEKYEIEGDFGAYRVMKREIPTDYSVTSIMTGYRKNGKWVWKNYFRPYYVFEK